MRDQRGTFFPSFSLWRLFLFLPFFFAPSLAKTTRHGCTPHLQAGLLSTPLSLVPHMLAAEVTCEEAMQLLMVVWELCFFRRRSAQDQGPLPACSMDPLKKILLRHVSTLGWMAPQFFASSHSKDVEMTDAAAQ